jgi:hypothetical protein
VGALTVTVVTDGTALRPDATQGLVVNATPDQVAAAMQAAGIAGPAMRNPYNVTFVETSARPHRARRRGRVASRTPTQARCTRTCGRPGSIPRG